MNESDKERSYLRFPAPTIPVPEMSPEMHEVFQPENQMINPSTLHDQNQMFYQPQVNHHDVHNMMNNPLSPGLPPLPPNLNDQYNNEQNQLLMMPNVLDYDYDYDFNDNEQDQALLSMVTTSDQKYRLRWNSQLHKQFVDAVHQLGGPLKATPKALLQLMNVPGLTRPQLKSHLQKFRMKLSLKSKRGNRGNNMEEEAPKSYIEEMLNYAPRISIDQEVLTRLILDKEAWKRPWEPQPQPQPQPQLEPQPQPLPQPHYYLQPQQPPQYYSVLESSNPRIKMKIFGSNNVGTAGTSVGVGTFRGSTSMGDCAMNMYNNSLVGGSVTGDLDGGNGLNFNGNFYGRP